MARLPQDRDRPTTFGHVHTRMKTLGKVPKSACSSVLDHVWNWSYQQSADGLSTLRPEVFQCRPALPQADAATVTAEQPFFSICIQTEEMLDRMVQYQHFAADDTYGLSNAKVCAL